MFPAPLAHMLDTLALVVGTPIVVYLLFTAVQRARRLRERVQQVQDELARSPLPPMAHLAQLMDEQDAVPRKKHNGKRPH